jgi:hypothetical protein
MKCGGLLASLFFCLTAGAGDFEFRDFASTKDLYLIRDARRSKQLLRLTDADMFLAGAAWYRQKQPVCSGFETTFTFRLTDQDRGRGRGADGLAFVVQNEHAKAIGGFGASAGFMRSDQGAAGPLERPILRRLAIFFDTFQNAWDDSGNHMAICSNGPAPDMRWPPRCLADSQKLTVNFKDGNPHTVRIVYDPPHLAVYLDESPEPVRAGALDLSGIVGGDGTAWVGFTAATGGGYENHDVLNWKFSAGPRGGAGSTMSTVDSSISFAPVSCLPDRTLCTLEQALVQDKGNGQFHVYLPANLEWGAYVPLARGTPARVTNVKGTVCWEPRLRTSSGCNGPPGNGVIPGKDAEGGADFLAPQKAAGSLVVRNLDGKLWFSVNDRTGEGFKDNEGYFEFDVTVGR